MWNKPQDWQLKAWYSTAPRGVMDFIYTYVHDFKVPFWHQGVSSQGANDLHAAINSRSDELFATLQPWPNRYLMVRHG